MSNDDTHPVELDVLEQTLLTTLKRINTADLPTYENLDISKLFRTIALERAAVLTQLQSMIENLDQVAALLRAIPPLIEGGEAEESRETIAVDFTDGARAIEQAKAALIQATENLEYLQYKMI